MGRYVQIRFNTDLSEARAYSDELCDFAYAQASPEESLGYDMFGVPMGLFDFDIVLMTDLCRVMNGLGMVTHPVPPDTDTLVDGAVLEADSGTPGIPAYKLWPDHRWLICPREIAAALAAYDSHDDPEQVARPLLDGVRTAARPDTRGDLSGERSGRDGGLDLARWRLWIRYLRWAAAEEGFEQGVRHAPARPRRIDNAVHIPIAEALHFPFTSATDDGPPDWDWRLGVTHFEIDPECDMDGLVVLAATNDEPSINALGVDFNLQPAAARLLATSLLAAADAADRAVSS